jgi:hypothetical protein
MLQAKMSLSLPPLLYQAVRKERRNASLTSRKPCQQSVQCHKMLLCQILCLIQMNFLEYFVLLSENCQKNS